MSKPTPHALTVRFGYDHRLSDLCVYSRIRLFQAHLLDGWHAWYVLILITFSSAMYFSDGGMKTEDYSFRGFPGCWNMVVIVFFGLTPPDWIILSVTTVLAIAMFLPIKFIHPTRTKRWRAVSLPMGAFWTICAGWAAWVSFDPQSWAHYGLMITSIYLLLAVLHNNLFRQI